VQALPSIESMRRIATLICTSNATNAVQLLDDRTNYCIATCARLHSIDL